MQDKRNVRLCMTEPESSHAKIRKTRICITDEDHSDAKK